MRVDGLPSINKRIPVIQKTLAAKTINLLGFLPKDNSAISRSSGDGAFFRPQDFAELRFFNNPDFTKKSFVINKVDSPLKTDSIKLNLQTFGGLPFSEYYFITFKDGSNELSGTFYNQATDTAIYRKSDKNIALIITTVSNPAELSIKVYYIEVNIKLRTYKVAHIIDISGLQYSIIDDPMPIAFVPMAIRSFKFRTSVLTEVIVCFGVGGHLWDVSVSSPANNDSNVIIATAFNFRSTDDLIPCEHALLGKGFLITLRVQSITGGSGLDFYAATVFLSWAKYEEAKQRIEVFDLRPNGSRFQYTRNLHPWDFHYLNYHPIFENGFARFANGRWDFYDIASLNNPDGIRTRFNIMKIDNSQIIKTGERGEYTKLHSLALGKGIQFPNIETDI